MISRGGRPKIRAPRKGVGGGEEDFDEIWRNLSESLRQIHTKNASTLQFEQLYRFSYKLVLKKQGESLYNNVQRQEREWLQREVQPKVISAIVSSLSVGPTAANGGSTANEFRASAERLMKALKGAWEDHLLCMAMTTDVLMYLDRVYCSENHRPYVSPMGMALFREHILRKTLSLPSHAGTTALDALVAIILGLIEMEREQEMIDRNLIRACVYMLEGLYETEAEHESGKLYLSAFEPAFLSTSRHFYQDEGVKIVQTMDTGSFCRRVQARLDEEKKRCLSTLSQMTLEKIHSVIDDELVRKQLPTAISRHESGVPFMLDNDRDEELRLVYNLNIRIDPKTRLLKDAIQKHIVLRGQAINEAAKDATQATMKPPPEQAQKPDGEGKPAPDKGLNQQTAAAIKWVDDVLRLKDKYDALLDRAFDQNKEVQAAMTKSFSEFINQFVRSSEYLSLFFDENLKKGIKGKTETEVDALLDNGITLLRYVQDKDMFERYYKKHLSRRLLMKRTVSMDAERQMISKMKLEVGNTFTQRIEQMFRDMDLSEDLTRSYKDHVHNFGDADRKRAELDVNVLTSTMWPLEAMGSAHFTDGGPTIVFPSSVDRLRQGFQNFYLDKHSGRKLTWQANMGTAEIRAHFPKSKSNIKTRELNVSTYAMIVLLLFNDLPADGSLTCAEIQARTNIPMHDLTRNLQSLAVAPKTRVLIKEPMSKDVKPDDRFMFNEAFHSPMTKIKIGVVSNTNRVEDTDERKETEKKNNDTRAGIIEAAIVRIMKQRKHLDHTGLVTEVIQQLSSRFVPDVSMVKKRIESLIEREYLERDESSPRPAYKYLA